MTPLHDACLYGQLDKVEHLLDAGAEMEAKNEADMTPLLYAAHQHHADIIRLLVNRGADVRAVSAGGVNVLLYLVQKSPELKETELETELESLAQMFEGGTYQSGEAELAAMRLLIDNGADIECKDAVGDPPLSTAVCAGNLPAVALLLDAGAEYLAFNPYDLSPLVYALREERVEIVKLLLDRAKADNRLAEIASESRYHKWIDVADDAALQLLDDAIAGIKAGRMRREDEWRRKEAEELEAEAQLPIEIWLDEDGRLLPGFTQGPIFKFCLNCLYPFNNYFNYAGSRYGLAGEYTCPRCHARHMLLDDDGMGDRIYYKHHHEESSRDNIVNGLFEKAGIEQITIDYARLYRLDALPKIAQRIGEALFDALKEKDHCSLREIMDILHREIPALRDGGIQRFDNRLNGCYPLPEEADAWINLVKTLLPEERESEEGQDTIMVERSGGITGSNTR